MSWMFYAVVAAAALAAADVFVKLASGKLPNSLGTLLYGAVAFAVGLTTIVLLTDDHRTPAIRTYLATGFRPCTHLWDWTHRPRWRAIRAALKSPVPDCVDSGHAAVLLQIRW